MSLSPAALAHVADYFKVLSEVSRLEVLCVLKTGEQNVGEIVEATGLGQANVSKHLKVLTQAGIISRRTSGTSVYYRISDETTFALCELVCQRLVDRLDAQARQLGLVG